MQDNQENNHENVQDKKENTDDFNLDQAYSDSFTNLEENTIVTGTVVSISNDLLFVNFGSKSEGKIPISEFDVVPKVGDEIDIFLVKMEGQTGEPVVSKKKADEMKVKDELWQKHKSNEPVTGEVSSVLDRRGFMVKYKGVIGFIPFRLFDTMRIEEPERFIGEKVSFYIEKIIQNNGGQSKFKTNESFLANRKRLIFEEKKILKKDFIENKQVGDIVDGIVRTITDYGAFVDVGGMDALLHINEIAWNRIKKVSDVLKVNQKITVKILKIDRENGKISIGLKQLQDNPWDIFIQKYKQDDTVMGTVTAIKPYGAFVKIIDGVEGLLHVSDLSWTKKIERPSDIVSVGQKIEVKIISIDEDGKRIGLSLKHLLENPWDNVGEKYKEGSKVKGKVTNITTFGMFVELEPGIEALLHIDDFSWTEDVKNINDLYKVGDEVEAIVIYCSVSENKIKIGLKQLTKNPWGELSNEYMTGDAIECEVIDIDEEKGLKVAVNEDIRTLIPFSHIAQGKIYDIRANIKKSFKIGDKVTALITYLDARRQKINISIKEYLVTENDKRVKEYLHNSTEDTKYTLGDIMKDKSKK